MNTNIAIVRRNGLGDFIAGTVPLYNCMVEDYGDNCFLWFFMSSSNYPLFKYFIDENKAKLAVFNKGNKYLSVISMACKNRGSVDKGYLTVPDYPKLTGLFLFLLGAKNIYGYLNKGWLSKFTINKGVYNSEAYADESKHVALLNLQLYNPKIDKIEKRWFPKFNKSKISKFDISIPGPYLMVELSNNRKCSQLETQKIVDIVLALRKHFVFTVLITAKCSDKSKVENLSSILNENSIANFFYATNDLDSYISFINKADVFLVGDGGIGHMAGALDKYVVSLYGKTSVDRWGILSDKAIILYDKDNVNNIQNERIIEGLYRCFKMLNN